MRANNKITTKELSAIVGIAKTNIARNVKKLIEKNIVKRVGAIKGGHWEI